MRNRTPLPPQRRATSARMQVRALRAPGPRPATHRRATDVEKGRKP